MFALELQVYIPDLLSVPTFAQQRELHHARLLDCSRCFSSTVLGKDACVSLSTSHWQGNVEHQFSLKFTGIQTLSHHLGKFAIELSVGLGVFFIFGSSDNNVLFF